MVDYRLPINRNGYFSELYKMNLIHRIMPGLVYLYMPALASLYNWDAEEKLLFAFYNGLTQNPITSLRMFRQQPSLPDAPSLIRFASWFDENWDTLQFDTDRRYQKRDTVEALRVYTELVSNAFGGSQEKMLTGKPFRELWDLVRNRYRSLGRLGAFSYLEYVYLNGFGADCDNLMFDDKTGSQSHRNGMLFLFSRDDLVWDQRAHNGFDGDYNLTELAPALQSAAESWLSIFRATHNNAPDISQFTLESNLCTFKNHFFGHRYPGIYADMAQERIEWADARGQSAITPVFKEIRAGFLPGWLRAECETPPRLSIKARAAQFPEIGFPFRGEYFL